MKANVIPQTEALPPDTHTHHTMVSSSHSQLSESSPVEVTESSPFPCAACHNSAVTADAELVAKIANQKKTMTVREICQANSMRQGEVAYLLYVAPKQQKENQNNENTTNECSEDSKSRLRPRSQC
jgi:hypothetical protein